MEFTGAALSTSFSANASAFNTTHYKLDYIIGRTITFKLHINLIVFDQNQLESTAKYKMNYVKQNFYNATTGRIPII